MKRLITIILVVSLLFVTSPVKTQAQVGPAVLVIVCAAAAGCIIFWVYKTNTDPTMRWLVLQKQPLGDVGNWQNVITNRVLCGPRLMLAFPAFGDNISNTNNWAYRIVEIPAPAPNFQIVYHYKSAYAYSSKGLP